MAKSVFTDPAPGERMIRSLANEIERETHSLIDHYTEASQTKDSKLVRRVNDALLMIEGAANQLRTMDVSPNPASRAQNAIRAADATLERYASLEENFQDKDRLETNQEKENNPENDLNETVVEDFTAQESLRSRAPSSLTCGRVINQHC